MPIYRFETAAQAEAAFAGRMASQKTYQVRGRGPFPTDMLRYDESEPATPEDAAAIARLSVETPADDLDIRAPHTVTLRYVGRPGAGYRVPTRGRW
jgi:hypothetical protein